MGVEVSVPVFLFLLEFRSTRTQNSSSKVRLQVFFSSSSNLGTWNSPIRGHSFIDRYSNITNTRLSVLSP